MDLLPFPKMPCVGASDAARAAHGAVRALSTEDGEAPERAVRAAVARQAP
ncbi:hypothetical protein [Sorangium cellulosum]|nr:hypothetical protein [Sorangium cellulosum]